MLLSACFSITGQGTSQRDVIGDFVVATELCLLDSSAIGDGTCESGMPGNSDFDVQYFMGYLVSDFAGAPDEVRWTGGLGDHRFAPSAEYSAALAAQLPPPAGHRWAGYRSARMAPIVGGTDVRVTATAEFAIPASAPAELALATVHGWRPVREADPLADPPQAALTIDRPIVCGDTAVGSDGAPTDDGTACTVSSLPAQPTTLGAAPVLEHHTLSAAQLTPPAAVVGALPGERAVMDFTAATRNATGAPATLPLRAFTALPGAELDAPAALELGEDATLPVAIRVPEGAAPGDYAVTLALASGQREATATLRVEAPPAPAPAPAPMPPPAAAGAAPAPERPRGGVATSLEQTATLLKQELEQPSLRAGLRSGKPFDLNVDVPARGFVRISIVVGPKGKKKKRPPVLAVGTGATALADLTTIRVRPTRQGRAVLRAGGQLRGFVVVRIWARTGKTVSAPLRLKLG